MPSRGRSADWQGKRIKTTPEIVGDDVRSRWVGAPSHFVFPFPL